MSRTPLPLVDRLSRFDALVEVGIGRRTGLAAALEERGVRVVATDLHERSVPDGVRFVRDDVTDPEPAVYADAELLYARNLPAELHRPLLDLARRIDAGCWFTTLGGEEPVVPIRREPLPRETLYVARSPA